MIKVGITKEYKIPNDFRTPFTPKQSKIIDDSSNFRLVCQRSEIRCYKDDEYLENKISLVDKLDDCEVIFAIKHISCSLIQSKNKNKTKNSFKK